MDACCKKKKILVCVLYQQFFLPYLHNSKVLIDLYKEIIIKVSTSTCFCWVREFGVN